MSTLTQHWDSVYSSKRDGELSWTQSDPITSLSLIGEACPETRASRRVIDVGGGTSPLAGKLLDRGYSVAVLDISQVALDRAREQVGSRRDEVEWIVADVTGSPRLAKYDVWHDRAVFHFLITPDARAAYRNLLLRTVPLGGHAVIATFALDGPGKCSGLDVCRYDAAGLSAELGQEFELVKTIPELHLTPWGQAQSFQYSLFRRTSAS